MGILGMTGDARWPRLGVLHKGAPKPNDKQPGRDLGERLRFAPAGEDADIGLDWQETFGGMEVDELAIRLPYGTVDANWQAWKEHWVAGGLVYRCDGKDHVLWRDDAGEYRTDPTPCPGSPRCEAKAVGRLELVCLDLARLGTVTLVTTSINDIRNIDGCLRALALTVGDLSRIPMFLKRVPRDISTPGQSGKRQRRRTHLLHLEAAPDWVKAIRDGRQAVALLETVDVPALPPPEVGVDMVTGELVDASANGWGERIAACVEADDLDCLHAMHAQLPEIEPPPYRENVTRLWYAGWVQIARHRIPHMTTEGLGLCAAKLEAIPDGTPGKAEGLVEIENAMWGTSAEEQDARAVEMSDLDVIAAMQAPIEGELLAEAVPA